MSWKIENNTHTHDMVLKRFARYPGDAEVLFRVQLCWNKPGQPLPLEAFFTLCVSDQLMTFDDLRACYHQPQRKFVKPWAVVCGLTAFQMPFLYDAWRRLPGVATGCWEGAGMYVVTAIEPQLLNEVRKLLRASCSCDHYDKMRVYVALKYTRDREFSCVTRQKDPDLPMSAYSLL